MTAAALARPSAPATSRAEGIVAGWRDITRADVRAAVLCGLAICAYHFLVWSFGMLQRPQLWRPMLATFVAGQLWGFALLLAITAAKGASAGRNRRRVAYAIALVVAGAIIAPVESFCALSFVQGGVSATELRDSSIYTFCEWLIIAGAATLMYLDRERARAARSRMHVSEIDRTIAARRTLESRLQAMQARVEPRFLFNTLAQIRDLYRVDAQRGERMFDELIAYLQAAMPGMRDTASTVSQELDLVRAYLGIVRLRLGERLDFLVEAPGECAAARMPPMMLLPLVDHAVAQGAGEPEAKRSLRIRTTVAEGRIRLEVFASGDSFLPGREGEDIGGIRERLAALYNRAASLTLHRGEHGASRALLEFPIETTVPSRDTSPASAWAATDAAAGRAA